MGGMVPLGDAWRLICCSVGSGPSADRARPSLDHDPNGDVHAWQLVAHHRQHDFLMGLYVIVFTTSSCGSTVHVLRSYRMRWQIELVFKRLKSLAQLGHVPKHDDRSSRVALWGKLLVTLLAQKLIRIGRDISPSGYPLSARGAM